MAYQYKVQIVQPKNLNPKKSYSVSHQFDSPGEQIAQKRGLLFASLNLNSDVDFELDSMAKLFLEHIEKKYYEQTEKTPLQALESTVQESLEIVKNSKSKDEKIDFSNKLYNSEISVAVCLIWNHILYIANIGKNANYVIRGSGSRDLLEDNEDSSEVKISSILLFDDDVIIIGTEKFAEIFPAKEILEHISAISTLINDNEKFQKLSVLIIKTKAEQMQDKKAKDTDKNNKSSILKMSEKLAFWHDKKPPLSETFKQYQNKKPAPISSISDLNKSTAKEMPVQTQTRRRIRQNPNFDNTKVIIGVAIFLLISSLVVTTYLGNTQTENTNNETEITTINTSTDTTTPTDNKQIITEQINPATEYASLDFTEAPTSFDLYKENILMYIPDEKTIKYFDIKTKKSKTILSEIENFEQMKCFEKFCVIAFNKLSYIFDPNTPDKIDKYSLNIEAPIIDIAIYSDRIYYLTSKMIYWVKIGDKESVVSPWLKNNVELQNALGFSIDTDIYVLEINKVRQFASGVEQKLNLRNQNIQDSIAIYAGKNELFLLDILSLKVYKFDEAKEILTNRYSMSDYAKNISPDNIPLIKYGVSANPKIYYIDNQKIYLGELKKE